MHTNPDVECKVYCFGWEKSLIDSFRNEHDVDFCYVSVTDQVKLDVRENVRSGEALKLKVKCINDFLFERSSAALWIDADSLVSGDLEGVSSKIVTQGFDVICTRRKHRKLHHEAFALGVLGFSNTEISREFMGDFNERVSCSEGVEGWFQDQLEFYRVFVERKPRFYSLRRHEHTLKGVTESTIYSRRESINLTPREVAKVHGIPIKRIDSLPENIYPI